ncbi:MAG TPA: TIGR04283 family arsenosugar biosynthesis glycosyltransferase [Kiloniellaceae bacterium]|nr:TIGR04283 family arsenosugar biosynthesis glycosyltransferase [Kiloniellaceae bacterium]
MESSTTIETEMRRDGPVGEGPRGPLSAIVPTLNAEATLPATLAALAAGTAAGLLGEVLVVDGGSRDGTEPLAAAAGAVVLSAPRGRGRQLAAGATAAGGAWLLFLHADTVLAPDWTAVAESFMNEVGPSGARAAVFRFALDDEDPRARRIERLACWRGRVLGLPYGDQGLLISKDFYRRLGGYRPLELMEDVDLVRRIGRRRLARLDVDAVTSAARYRRDGWTWRPLCNLLLLGLYFLGLPSRALSRLYR